MFCFKVNIFINFNYFSFIIAIIIALNQLFDVKSWGKNIEKEFFVCLNFLLYRH